MNPVPLTPLQPFTFEVTQGVEGLGLRRGQRVIVDPANPRSPVVLVQDLSVDYRVVVALAAAGVLEDANGDQPLELLTELAEGAAPAERVRRRFSFPGDRKRAPRSSHLKVMP